MNSNYFTIGKIVNTQGIKGEMRIIPYTDNPERFEILNYVYVDKKGIIKTYEIQSIRYHKQFILLKFKGIDDMTSAERFKNCELKIDEKDALPLDKDEYYIRDLYDMKVQTQEGELLGEIKDIIFTGANDVYVVKDEDEKEILIPAIKKCILDIDIKNKKMTVKLMEGLR